MPSEPPIEEEPATPAGALGEALARLYYVARRDYQTDLTHRAIRVLQFIAYRTDPPRLDDVKAFLGCAPSTASELIKRLQKKGLLIRSRSAGDERAISIELTDAGVKAVAEHTSLDPRLLEEGLAELVAEERIALVRSIQRMVDRLDRR